MENLNSKIVDLLNYRIQQEEMSVRIYLQMANELNYHGYFGAAKLWKKYSDEEKIHAEKVYNFLLDLDYLPETPALEQPKTYNGDFIEIIKASYLHEQEVTRQCEELYLESMKQNCVKGMGLAQWFVNEQVEELQKTKAHLDFLDAFGTEKVILQELDERMKKLAK